jgi:putative thiamine transport system permease protein
MLSGPLAGTLAVGFAVSVAQFLATQFLGAGRHATVTTEAVLLASGGQRTVAAAFAALQAALPLLAFGLAAWVSRRATIRA